MPNPHTLFLKGFGAVAVAALFPLTTQAHADEIGNTVTCSASVGSCGAASGTVATTFTITATGGMQVSEEFTGTQILITFLSTGNLPTNFSITNTDTTAAFNSLSKVGGLPSGYNGYSISSGTLTFNFSTDHVTDGDVLTFDVGSAASVTPEPSSLVLLGTGLVAGCGVLRRRLIRS